MIIWTFASIFQHLLHASVDSGRAVICNCGDCWFLFFWTNSSSANVVFFQATIPVICGLPWD